MNHDDVRRLEAQLEQAIGRSLADFYQGDISPDVLHLMAKAAVTVLEAAETHHPPRRPTR